MSNPSEAQILNPIKSICYASVSCRLYALREDGSIHYRDERDPRSPWKLLPDVIQDPLVPVEQAPELSDGSELPPAPQSTGIAGMLDAPAVSSDAAFQPSGASQGAGPATQAPAPIIPQR